MPNSQRTTRILCIYCNICVNTLRRYHIMELDTRVISIVSSWIAPVIITDEDYICEQCWEIAMQAVNNQNQETSFDGQLAGPSHRGHTKVCLLCGRSLQNRQSDLIVRENPSELHIMMMNVIEARIVPRQVTPSDRVCHPCWLRSKRSAVRMHQIDDARTSQAEATASQMTQPSTKHEGTIEQQPDAQHASHEEQHSLESHRPSQEVPSLEASVEIRPADEYTGNIRLPNYRRAANTASHCLFPNCANRGLHSISDNLRATVLSNCKFYIPILARTCVDHMHSNDWDNLFNAENSISTFTAEQIEHVFSFVNSFKPNLDFSSLQAIEEIDNKVLFYWLGMSKEHFSVLLNEVPRIQAAHRGVLGLAALLIKMRTGESDNRLSVLLEVPRRTLERLMANIKEILLQDFVPSNLGINHISREQLLTHNLSIANALYNNERNDRAIVICDGTYIYLNKSSNYKFQKDTYSLHKYRNLIKPFLIVASDGYIVECYGSYKATTSDAEIMNSLFRNENEPLRSYFQEDDVFILDRGFRDSISLLENCNYRAYMPESLEEGEHQLTTTQANKSRCVTICRWVVEVVNGYFKRDYKLLRQDFFNKSAPNVMQIFEIAASLINRFGVRLRDRNDATDIISIIRERIQFPNTLSQLVESMNLNRRSSNFNNITADRDNLIIFPRLQYNELILFALGTYQIRQARSYYGEHIRFHGEYRIEVSSEHFISSEYNLRGSGDTTLIRGKIKSRHITRKQYYVYILVENNVSGREGIVEYCCNCLVGRRTIGCCAHVMTLVWYLGWARYEGNISAPAEFLDDLLIIVEDTE